MGAERDRVAGFGHLEDGLRQGGEWYRWGPYVSERQWGTVREDYSADGNAWDSLPHDQARSRAYRWGEDGLAGFCDIEQRLCLGLALWNGRDPILKERPFGLTGPQGNHGEDVKEYWWYLDAVPSHAWNRWRYHYPQGPFPYQDLIDTNARRSRYEPEYELLDTGAFDGDRYWITEVHYAKAGPDDLLMAIQVTNAGPETETLHVLPTAWFRNTWSWGDDEPRPALRATGDRSVTIDHPFAGTLELIAAAGPDGAVPQLSMQRRTGLADRGRIGRDRRGGLCRRRLGGRRLIGCRDGQRGCQAQRGSTANAQRYRISQHLPRRIQQPAFKLLVALRRAQHRVVVLDRNALFADRLFGRGACPARQGLPAVGGVLGFGLHRVFLLDARDMAGSHADLGHDLLWDGGRVGLKRCHDFLHMLPQRCGPTDHKNSNEAAVIGFTGK